jgi:glycosyltransferase involved in cell wall biosynthesis
MTDIDNPLSIMMLGLRGFPCVQGGIETHAEHLCPLLVEQEGCKVTVLVRSPYQPVEIGQSWKSVEFISIWAPKIEGLEAIFHTFLGVLYAAIKRPDILHIHGIGPSIMVLPARLLGLWVVVTHHGPDYDRQKWGWFARIVLKLGEYVGMRWSNERIVISKVIADLVRKKYGMESELIPNGVLMPQISNSIGVLEAFGLTIGLYVLMVSRLVPEKRHLDLIAAFNQANLTDWKLVIVGDTSHPDTYQCEVLENAAKSKSSVVMTGFQSGLELQELYSHAGFFVLPSSHEGMPIVVLEALSYGLPVLVSDIPPHIELGLSEEHYFPLGNIEALADRIKLMSTEGMAMSSREYSREFVSRLYNWQKVAEKTRKVYDRKYQHLPKADSTPKCNRP